MPTPVLFDVCARLTRCAWVGLTILTTFGCQSTPTDPPPKRTRAEVVQPAQDAESLLEAAARSRSRATAAPMYLEAARQLLARGESARAGEALRSVERGALAPRLQFVFDLTLADVATETGRPAEAFAILRAVQPDNSEERRERDLALERAAAGAGRFAEAAEALMAVDSDDSQALHDRIWGYLVRTPPTEVDARAAMAPDAIRLGWWRLAAAVERAFDVAEQRTVLARWQTQFAQHPAAQLPPSALRRLDTGTSSVRHIALLLPMSGQLATAGRAVRDGFVSAFYRAGPEGSERSIRVYDTTSREMSAVYEQAVLDGGNVIVGPLDKTNVSALNGLPVRMLPALALNHLAEGEVASPGVVQFALAIEDEGRAIADRVAEDRRERIVLLRADQDWAARATAAFLSQPVLSHAVLSQHVDTRDSVAITVDSRDSVATGVDSRDSVATGRDLVAAEGMIYDIKSLTESISRVLFVDQSTARANEIATLLGERPEFVPRRRRDVDAVVAFVDALQARALQPALAYFFAGDVPVYTSSQAVQGLDANGLSELDGARVCQIPWRIGTDPLRRDVEAAFADAAGSLSSLFAFGVDAYRIVDRLDALATEPHARILGATGILTFGQDARIRRDPAWAIVRRGRLEALPVLVDIASE